MAARKMSCHGCNWAIVIQEGQTAPDRCGNPECGRVDWQDARAPKRAYKLSANDRRLLKSFRIASDEDGG